MPYPAQVNRAAIIAAARDLVEQEGAESLSLGQVASALGIKAPSLYRHVRDKSDLMRGVNDATIGALFDHLSATNTRTAAPLPRLLTLARAYRDFALARPRSYALAFSTTDASLRPDPIQVVQRVLPLQAAIAPLSGEAQSLDALRGLLSIMHGFISLELNEQLQRGGNLEETYMRVVEVYLRGWEINTEK